MLVSATSILSVVPITFVLDYLFSFKFSMYNNTFMFVELLNDTFTLFINNVFYYCEIILEYIGSQVLKVIQY
jgi:hypothetical protein